MTQQLKSGTVIILYLVSFLFLIFSGSQQMIGVIAAGIIIVLLTNGELRSLYPIALFSLVSGVVVFLINGYFQGFEGPNSISSAVTAGLRIFALIALSLAYMKTVDGDLTYEVCSRFIPRSAILTALSLLLIPRLTESYRQTRFSLEQRGVVLRSSRSLSLLIMNILVNAVEESWAIAEALVQRGYTTRQR